MEKQMHVYNVCESRGTPRSRIWIEGDRLLAAGFKHGATYSKTWSKTSLTLEVVASVEGMKRGEFGTVCGKKDRPIVDIVGGMVRQFFGNVEKYKATFTEGRIVIHRA